MHRDINYSTGNAGDRNLVDYHLQKWVALRSAEVSIPDFRMSMGDEQGIYRRKRGWIRVKAADQEQALSLGAGWLWQKGYAARRGNVESSRCPCGSRTTVPIIVTVKNCLPGDS